VRYDQAQTLTAHDVLELDDADLRALALEERKAPLARLLRNALAGIRQPSTSRPTCSKRRAPARLRGHCLETAQPLRLGPLDLVAQGQEPRGGGGAPRGDRGLGLEDALMPLATAREAILIVLAAAGAKGEFTGDQIASQYST